MDEQRPPETPDDDVMSESVARHYWRDNVRLIGVLLAIWFTVSVLGGIVFVEWLNNFTIGKVPLGFWIGHQGSILVFVVLIGVYVLMMDRIDKKHGIKRE